MTLPIDDVVGPLSEALTRAAIQGGMAAAVVWAVCTAVRVPARVRCWLWRLAAAKFIVALFVATPIDVPVLARETVTPSKAAPFAEVLVRDVPPAASDPAPARIAADAPADPDVVTSARQNPFLVGLLVAWLAGASIGVALLVRGCRIAARWRHLAQPMGREDAVLALADLRRALRLREAPALLKSAAVPGPLLTGVLRPAVILPEHTAADATPGELRLLLAHELAHVRRRDLLWSWLTAAVGVLFFFHPLAWLLRRELRLARESACDELALRVTRATPSAYASLLLSFAHPPRRALPSLALGVSGSARLLRRRLRALRDAAMPDRGHLRVAAVAVALVAIPSLLPWRLVPRSAAATDVTQPAATTQPGEVTGQVLGPDGKPIAGATVSLIVEADPGSYRTAASTRTDEAGRYALPAPPPPRDGEAEAGRLLVEAAGYALAGGGINTGGSRSFRLAPGVELRVRVLGPDGKPVAGLRLAPELFASRYVERFDYVPLPADAERLGRVTDADGWCVFPDLTPRTNVRFRTPDERFARLTVESMIPVQGPPRGEAELRLEAAGSIRGRVVFGDTGKPAAGVRVMAHARHDGPRARTDGWGHAVTAADGTYRIGRLPPASYNVSAHLPDDLARDWTAAALQAVDVPDGRDVTAGADLKLVRGAVLTGRVLKADTREPVPGMAVGLHGPSRPRSGGGIDRAVTDADGVYRLRVPPGEQYVYLQSHAPPGYVRPAAPTHEPVAREGETLRLDIELQPDAGPFVTGRVVGPGGEPVAGAWVTAEPQDVTRNWHDRHAQTDANGGFRISVAGRGRFLLRAGHGSRGTVAPTDVGGDAAAEGVVLELSDESLAPLSVRVTDAMGRPLPKAGVRLSRRQGDMTTTAPHHETVDADGWHTFEPLRTDGRYSVDAVAEGYAGRYRNVSLRPGKKNEVLIMLK